MIVYSDRAQTVSTRQLIAEIDQLSGVDRLIAFGQLEAGVVDALCRDVDEDCAVTRAFRSGEIPPGHLPETITIRDPEGYAYYALYPEMYAQSARRFLAECRPEHCCVIGIRSIGASLSRVVACELEADSITVRPHGHPFERYVKLGPGLSRTLRTYEWFAVVDEGPGISGSSFAAVARALNELGIGDNRIVFFPSWDHDGSGLRSAEARQRWPRHRRYVTSFETCILPQLGSVRDASGGKWRELLEVWPAVQTQHERRKYLRGDTLLKFAGLGRIAHRKLARAQLLADAGYTPGAVGIENGFISTRWEAGEPVTAASPRLVARMREYIAFLEANFQVDGCVRFDEIMQMIEVNTGRSPVVDRSLIEGGRLTAVDGRMLPHEWIATAHGYFKTDALDHHDDHFFPGCQDIAWDIAGAEVEFDLPPGTFGDNPRLPFYRIAYCSYRLGYARMAQEALAGDPDGERFRSLGNRYESLVGQLLS
ncbi:MAG TPA: hypothetical protein VFL57_17525 [Bryobacteraceae bacterium]|nr:hypothetical protein [Bryobacteraceae bacterium]